LTFFQSLKDLLLALLAALPFLGLYAGHYTQLEEATWWLHGDMPYYAANAREIFERGNGFAYPNPYDPDPHAPVIYFHWLLWFMGFGIVRLGIDPGVCSMALGIIAGVAFSYLTLRLVRVVAGPGREIPALFLLAMWGGGVAVLTRMMANAVAGRPILDALLDYDIYRGLWMLSWGRNMFFPTEAAYHALAAGAWLGVLAGRPGLALVPLALLMATHPYSGLQNGLIFGVWMLLEAVRRPNPATVGRLGAVTALNAAFLGYYFIYLGSFPQHRQLQEELSLSWITPWRMILTGYGLVGPMALVRLLRDRRNLHGDVGFLLVAAAVSFLLVKHELFIKPRQPLHFTRGYLWMALALIAMPLVRDLLSAAYRSRSVWPKLAVALAALVAVSDNVVFLLDNALPASSSRGIGGGHAIRFGRDLRELLAWINNQRLRGELISPDPGIMYLAATYTPLDPYCGYMFHTPDHDRRAETVSAWAGPEHAPAPPSIRFAIVQDGEIHTPLPKNEWTLLHRSGRYSLYERHVIN
jgi:hypothetical protein